MNDDTRKWQLYSRLYLLAAMALSGFALSIRMFSIDRIRRNVMYNAGIDALGMFVCVALYFGCIDEDNPDTDASTVWLMALILQIGFCFFNNELIWYLSGVGEYRQFYLFLNCLSDIYDQLLVSLFYNYVRRMLNFKGRLSRWLDRYIFILLIPIFILIMANCFVPITFSVDESGIFQRLPLYHLPDIYTALITTATIVLIIRCEATKVQKIVALSFVVTPIIYYLFTRGAHAYATQYGANLFAVTQIYSILFSYSNRKLASTRTELETATKIQTSLLPNSFPAFPERSEFDFYASMEPAREVGGDFYDFYLADDDHLCIVMADVSGKGVPGAMFMMISKIIIKNSVRLGEGPAKAVSTLNKAI